MRVPVSGVAEGLSLAEDEASNYRQDEHTTMTA